MLQGLPTEADMEWWSQDQVTSWTDTILWVPHHTAGLICCLFGFLLIWVSQRYRARQRWLCGIFAGFSFASAFGLSIWVALAFAILMAAWSVWVLRWEPLGRQRPLVLLVAGAIAVVLLLPYLNELRSETSSQMIPVAAKAVADPNAAIPGMKPAPLVTTSPAGATHILRFGIRHIIAPEMLLQIEPVADLARSYPRLEEILAELFLLLPGYFLELGFFGLVFIVAIMGAGRDALDEPARTALFLAAAGLVLASLVRSNLLANNDFGIRSMLIVQFFLLLLAVAWSEGAIGNPGSTMRILMNTTLWIGLAGTAYQVMLLRFYLPAEEIFGPAHGTEELAERSMVLRLGFDRMNTLIPRDAVVQFDTGQPGEYFNYAQVMQVQRQMANGLPDCLVTFGGDPAACKGIQTSVARLFPLVHDVPPSSVSREGILVDKSLVNHVVGLPAADARTECGGLGVTFLIVTRWDGIWSDRQSWVWTLPAILDTGDMRVLDCSQAAAALRPEQ
jgi:hypothetical protein